MKVQIVSDLHLEFLSYNQVVEIADRISYNNTAEVLILPGDICSFANHSSSNLCYFLGLMRKRYPHIIYVLGNHEHYGTSKKNIENLQSNLFEGLNIHILENNSVCIGDINFYGTTLWFEENVDTSMNRYYMNDYRCIQDFDPDAWSRKAIQFIKSIPNDEGKKILITHHVPHSRFISEKYVGNDMNCFYLNEVGKFLDKFDLVTFGHSHESVDYQFSDRCRAISNPRGYLDSPNEGSNDKFQYQLIVEV